MNGNTKTKMILLGQKPTRRIESVVLIRVNVHAIFGSKNPIPHSLEHYVVPFELIHAKSFNKFIERHPAFLLKGMRGFDFVVIGRSIFHSSEEIPSI